MRNKILIVDDMEINRDLLEEMLKSDYLIEKAENGRIAIEMLEKLQEELAVVLLDIVMPVMDGYAVLDVMRARSWMERIPVLVISDTDAHAERECFKYGISDFIRKPFDSFLVKKRVQNVADLYSYKNDLEKRVEIQTMALKHQYQLLQLQANKLQKHKETIIDVLGTVVEYRSLENGQHIQRVKLFTQLLAEQLMADYPELELTTELIEVIVSASPLHDIGKIAIPDSILLKPGKLTAEEFEFMKSHTIRGGEILNHIEDVWDATYRKICHEICRHHHERYDGRGYPDGLVGEEIPLSAQIVSIADVYDALVSERIYKSAYTTEQAYHMIMTGECGVFSPKLLSCFRAARPKLEALVPQLQTAS